MTSYGLRPPMRWNAAIGVIGRGKRGCTESAARAVERGVLPWICSENPVPTAETKPLRRYTRRAGDTHDPESLLLRLSSPETQNCRLCKFNGGSRLRCFQ